MVLDKIASLASTFSLKRWEIQMLVLGKKNIFLDFYYSVWKYFESRSYVSPSAMGNSKLCSFL